MRCPNCREPLDSAVLACPNGHVFSHENGVLVLLADDFRASLQSYAARLHAIREIEGRKLLDTSRYEQLPSIEGGVFRHEWRLRRADLAVVRGLLAGRVRQRVLDVGAWNGWLSHRLVEQGHDVTGTDYFADEYDGLGARRWYCASWRTIQLDLAD